MMQFLQFLDNAPGQSKKLDGLVSCDETCSVRVVVNCHVTKAPHLVQKLKCGCINRILVL
jgi:hypothetical protein